MECRKQFHFKNKKYKFVKIEIGCSGKSKIQTAGNEILGFILFIKKIDKQ